MFLDFLSQLRGYYLKRTSVCTFHSVILAGVHDIRNLKQKIRPDSDHKHNSPWNIASSFDIEMSFSADDIAVMLEDYENDHRSGMNIIETAQLIYDYTSGYPVLVSEICKINDEVLGEDNKWTRNGIVSAAGIIVSERQPLFESLVNKLEDSSELRDCVHSILMNGERFSYNPDDDSVNLAVMYGFITVENGMLKIANRIFETRLYNAFLTSNEMQNSRMYKSGTYDKTQMVRL